MQSGPKQQSKGQSAIDNCPLMMKKEEFLSLSTSLTVILDVKSMPKIAPLYCILWGENPVAIGYPIGAYNSVCKRYITELNNSERIDRISKIGLILYEKLVIFSSATVST